MRSWRASEPSSSAYPATRQSCPVPSPDHHPPGVRRPIFETSPRRPEIPGVNCGLAVVGLPGRPLALRAPADTGGTRRKLCGPT
jgi:hypothetical protein